MPTLNQIAYFPKEKQSRATAARVWLDRLQKPEADR